MLMLHGQKFSAFVEPTEEQPHSWFSTKPKRFSFEIIIWEFCKSGGPAGNPHPHPSQMPHLKGMWHCVWWYRPAIPVLRKQRQKYLSSRPVWATGRPC
jgi:hypothetical protein